MRAKDVEARQLDFHAKKSKEVNKGTWPLAQAENVGQGAQLPLDSAQRWAEMQEEVEEEEDPRAGVGMGMCMDEAEEGPSRKKGLPKKKWTKWKKYLFNQRGRRGDEAEMKSVSRVQRAWTIKKKTTRIAYEILTLLKEPITENKYMDKAMAAMGISQNF